MPSCGGNQGVCIDQQGLEQAAHWYKKGTTEASQHRGIHYGGVLKFPEG